MITNHFIKNACGTHILQSLSIIFFGFGLFFFQKQLAFVSHSDLKFVGRDSWFEDPMYQTIGFFITPKLEINRFIEQLPQNISFKTMNLKREPQCFEGQEISALMSGSYSSLLDYIYTQDQVRNLNLLQNDFFFNQLIEDSILHQLNHTQKITVFIGQPTFWHDIFPDMEGIADYEESNDIQNLLLSEQNVKPSFIVGLIEEKEQFQTQIVDSLKNLTSPILLLFLECNSSLSILLLKLNLNQIEQDCSIYQSQSTRLLAISNSKFQEDIVLPEIDREEIDLTSTLSAMLGVPIPFSNFGQIIPELYSSDMNLELKEGEYVNSTRRWYTVLYHILLNAHQMEHYLIEFSKRYPFFFDEIQVKELKKNIEQLSSIFTKIGDDLVGSKITQNKGDINQEQKEQEEEEQKQGEQENQISKEEIEKLEKQIRDFSLSPETNEKNLDLIEQMKKEIVRMRKVMKKVEIIIQQSNYGQIHIMLTSFLFFLGAALIYYRHQINIPPEEKIIINSFLKSLGKNCNIFVRYINGIISLILLISLTSYNEKYWMIINVLIVEIIFMIFSSNSKQSIKRSMFSLIATGWFLGAFDNVFSFLEIISQSSLSTIIASFIEFTTSLIQLISFTFLLTCVVITFQLIKQNSTINKTLTNTFISLNILNLFITAISQCQSLISHDLTMLIIILLTITSTIILRVLLLKDYCSISYEQVCLLMLINILPGICAAVHSLDVFFSLSITIILISNFIIGMKQVNRSNNNNRNLNSLSSVLIYLLFIGFTLIQHGFLHHTVELSSLQSAIHLDHITHSHNSKQNIESENRSNSFFRLLNFIQKIRITEFQSIFTNLIVISAPSLIFGLALPFIYKSLSTPQSSQKTDQNIWRSVKEQLNRILSQTNTNISLSLEQQQQQKQQDTVLQREGAKQIKSCILVSSILQIRLIYISLILILSFQLDMFHFRIAKEVFIFRCFDMVILPATILLSTHFFTTNIRNIFTPTRYKNSEGKSEEMNPLTNVIDSSQEIINRSVINA